MSERPRPRSLALSALNIPTAADIERLTRRLRSVSQRLEGIEDGVHRINRALSEGSVERRLVAMEEQLKALSSKLSVTGKPSVEPSAKASPPRARGAAARQGTRRRQASASEKTSASAAKRTASKRSTRTARAKKSA